MLKQSQKKSIVELSIYLSFLIVTLIFVQRLLDGGVLYFDDGFFPFNPQLSFIQNISSWDSPFFPGGSYFGNFYYIPLIVAIWFFRDLGLTFSESESFYLAINLFTGAVGTYLLSKYIFRHYVIKQESNSLYALAGPAAASFYYIFNYQQMTYYGGEFYQGFILINFTPLFIYVVMRYLSTPVKFGVWNRFLAAISLTSL